MADQVYKNRRNPAKAQLARVGNYVAPIDTVGVDPAMKETMGIGVKAKAKKNMTAMDKLKGFLTGRKP